MSGAPIPCPLCGAREHRVLGVRGNREHTGADPHAEPHLRTNVARCTRCDLVYANPPIPEAAALEAAHYGDAGVYHASSSEERATAMFRDRLALVRRFATGSLLDVGAGKGEFVREAAKAGYRASGIEPSRDLADRAGPAVRWGFLDDEVGTFDVVTLNHVLEHNAHPLAFLTEVRRHLVPGGIVFVEVPNVDAYLARLVDAWFRVRGLDWSCRLSPVHPPFHSFGYTRRSLEWALEHAGFDLLETTTRSGRGRGTSGHRRGVGLALDAAFTVFSALGNRELLLAIARG